MNVDGAFKGERTGVGVIIKDEEGWICHSYGKNFRRSYYKDAHAELLAIWKGIEFAKELGLSNIWIESNCAPILRRIKEDKEEPPSIGTYYKDCSRWV